MTHARTALIGATSDVGAPILRYEFELDHELREVRRATLRVTAHGVVEASLNGSPSGGALLTPGWTSYEWRLRFQEYRVDALLAQRNVIGLIVGNGWWRGRLTWSGDRALYGPDRGAWAELEIEYAHGDVQVIRTDETWRTFSSAILDDDLYDGETIDARRIDSRWQQPGFDDSGWAPVRVLPFDETRLTPYVGPPVVRQDELRPIRTWRSPSNKTLVDFGQNLVGVVRLRVRGVRGDVITIRYAEVLEHDELGVRPLRSAKATDRFVLSGRDDVLEPTFTLHGFRFAEIAGWPGEIELGDLTAVVIGSDMTRIGRFECSDALLNRLHENVVWGLRGNFVDVPTDCPQRDERLGWTGDLAVFAPTAAFLYDVGPFLRDWLRDLSAEQAAQDGIVPFVVPDVLKYLPPTEFGEVNSTAIWSDAAVWVPWALWQAYGDDTVLADQFPSMTAHARRVRALLSPEGVWDTVFQFGDWLDPTAPPEDALRAKADSGVVATACAYRTARILADSAGVLGLIAERAEFTDMADDLQDAFKRCYVDADRIVSDAPTVYALAITFGLLTDAARTAAGNRLAALVEENGYRIATGFAGTPYICDALTMTGHRDAAYRLLTEKSCPSWLYPVTMGATTIWERWDAILPDGTINPGEMTSFNHYALGAVADWMHRTLGGIAPGEPGYQRINVAPRPGGGVTWARTTLETPRGLAEVAWVIDGAQLVVDVLVPTGATAVVDLEGQPNQELTAGRHRIEALLGDTSLRP